MSISRTRPQAPVAVAATLLALIGSAVASAEDAQDRRTYTVTPEFTDGALTGLRVEMRLTGDADGETVLQIPSSANPRTGDPLETFSDFSAAGATIAETARDLRTLTHAPGAPLVVSYRLTQKSAMRMNTLVQPRFFSTIGRRAFLGVQGREDFTFTFRWGARPAGWTLASDLEHRGRSGDSERDLYASTLIGGTNLVVREMRVGRGRFRIALPDDLGLDAEAFGDLVVRTAGAANRTWGDSAPEYLVSVTPVDLPGARVFSGLGLTDAYALFLTPDPELFYVKSTLTHEYLHTWISKRIGTPAPAWFREGFADYYMRLVNLQAGAFTPDEFARSWNETLLAYASSPYAAAPDPAVVEKAEQGDYDAQKIAYFRGSMIAALFDYQIRRATRGRLTLTDVLRAVKADFDRGDRTGDAATRLVLKARRLAGVDLQPDIDRHIGRGEPLRLPDDLFDGCAQLATIDLAAYDRGYRPASPGQPVTGVTPDGPAYAAGLRDGMIYLEREAGKPGDSRVQTAIRVKDGDQERVIRYFPAGTERLRVQEMRLDPRRSRSRSCARFMAGERS